MTRNRDADCLPLMRAELRQRWPAVKFSVTRHRGTAYGWASVSWTDGPAEKAVEAVAYCYQSARFDGMDDGYHSTGNVLPDGVYGLSGVSCTRHYSEAFTARLIAEALTRHPELAPRLTPENVRVNAAWHDTDGYRGGSPWAVLRTLGEDRTATLADLLPAERPHLALMA